MTAFLVAAFVVFALRTGTSFAFLARGKGMRVDYRPPSLAMHFLINLALAGFALVLLLQ